MATNQAQTLMDYLSHSFEETNTIQLLELPEGVTFDFKHGFLHMLENNLFSSATHKDPIQHLRKFIKLTNTVRQNQVSGEYIRLYAFPFSLNGNHRTGYVLYQRMTSLHGISA